MAGRRKKTWVGEAHVRLYAYELASPAWRTLDPDGRALLIELRALFRPSQSNTVFMSVREAMKRVGIGQRRVQTAFAALIERGWIAVDVPGGFSRKTRHASSYRLLNEASAAPGSAAAKSYMQWQPGVASEKTR